VQIIIPMSGFGERFRKAGYKVPKPLIEVDGKPIVAHIIDMFPGEKDFIFVCNQEHLDEPTYHMETILKKYCPSGRIVGIAPHKLGPIHSVKQVENLLDPKKPTIVNYCDFTCYFDWNHFRRFVKKTNCTGAILAYIGFHPHSLGKTNYAYMVEKNGWVKDVQEKQPYTNNRMEEFASSGTYYFSSAQIMIEAFSKVIAKNLNVGGEYYVSLAYKILLANENKVAVYPLQHFMQWGTPEDLAEYNVWSKTFKGLITTSTNYFLKNSARVIPMAGLGKRFIDEGYTTAKPLIQISGLPMVAQATNDLPLSEHLIFVLREDLPNYSNILNELKKLYPTAIIKAVSSLTDGQACTALIGLEALECNAKEIIEPITIGTCDSGVLYNHRAFYELATNKTVDVIVWGIRGYPNAVRNPNMYGWIDIENELIRSISVKAPLSSPDSDPIVLGIFTFRRIQDFKNALNSLIKRNGKVNGEFYIDSLINDAIDLGLNCYFFEVDSFLCWGTPNDLLTFEYWQSCFHKWHNHPYRLELDPNIPIEKIGFLDERYKKNTPSIPLTEKDFK